MTDPDEADVDVYNVDGTYVIAWQNVWFPGCYASEEAARYALTRDESAVSALQSAKIDASTNGGVITLDDLKKLEAAQ